MPYSGRIEATPLLEVLQIIAYTQASGVLWVNGVEIRGVVVYHDGGVVTASSPTARALLEKAASEPQPSARLSLRRIQVLVALRELLDLAAGDFRFERPKEPERTVDGVGVSVFYSDGALDTGDLLLVLERAMDDEQRVVSSGSRPEPPSEEARANDRYAPLVIQATLTDRGRSLPGYLTNLGEGGTFFNADEFPEPDSECGLEFELPWSFGRCQATAKVSWQRTDATDSRKGAGLSFLAFSPDSKERLTAYLARFEALAADVDDGT